MAQEKMLPNHSAAIGRALNSNIDVFGKEVLSKGEPTFDAVAGYFPEMQRPREVVGVKDSPDDFVVDWDGEIQAWHMRYSFRLGDPPSPYGIEGKVTRSLLDGYLPIVETSWNYDGLAYHELVLGYSENLNEDAPQFALVRIRAQNNGATEKKATLRVYYDYTFGAPTPTVSAEVPANGYRDFYFKLPYRADFQHTVETVSETEFNSALKQTKEFWTKLLAQGMQIRTPEKRINDAYRAWLAYNFLNVDKINGIYEIHDGTFFYEGVWGYSAAIYCNALSQFGYWEDAEKYLDSMLKTQGPDGSIRFKEGMGFPDNGATLFAIADQYLLSRNLTWFKSVAPQAIRAAEWVVTTRNQTKVPGTESHVTWGLLPAGQSGGDFGRPVNSYYSNAYNWLGLHELGIALRAAGMNDEADKWSHEADEYRNDILTSMQRALIDVGSFKALPVEPLTHRLINEGGGDYYGLFASMILETGIFPPTDNRSKWITEYMDQRGGLLLGMDRFHDGVDHAYTYGYAMTALRRRETDKFLLTLYSWLAYGMSRDTYSAVEVTHIAQGLNEMTLPHTRSNTQQLRMLRMMLVREDGDNLILASATPRAWVASGEPLEVTNAPTVFGNISYTLRPDAKARTLHVVIEPLKEQSRKGRQRNRERAEAGGVGRCCAIRWGGARQAGVDRRELPLGLTARVTKIQWGIKGCRKIQTRAPRASLAATFCATRD
jgi:hypothetical protein